MTDEILYRIRSEEDALSLLKDAFDGKVDPDIRPVFEWDGWPLVKINLPETPISGSISPPMMEAFIELQHSILRSHAILSSGTSNIRSLSKIEKDAFGFRVKVKEGSSLYTINLQEIAQKLGADVIAKMTGQELVITVLGIALIIGGVIAWRAFLDNRTDQRRIDSTDADTRARLDSFKTQLDHDTARYELLTRALTARPVLKQIEQVTEPVREEIVKAIAEEHGGNINGIELDPLIANEMSVRPRQQSSEIAHKRLYKVSKVDTTVPDGFRVLLTDVKNNEEVSASLLDALVSRQHRDALRDAEWKKLPILVSLKGKKLRGNIIDAVITSVESAPVPKTKN